MFGDNANSPTLDFDAFLCDMGGGAQYRNPAVVSRSLSKVGHRRVKKFQLCADGEVCIRLRNMVGLEATASTHIQQPQPKVTGCLRLVAHIRSAWARNSGITYSSSIVGIPLCVRVLRG